MGLGGKKTSLRDTMFLQPHTVKQPKQHISASHMANVQICAGSDAGKRGRKQRETRANVQHEALVSGDETISVPINAESLGQGLAKCI